MPKAPIHLLLMEDSPADAELFRRKMESASLVVDHAPDGERGLALYHSGDYDLLVLDQAMPGLGGLEVLRHLASRGPLPPIVMVTGCGNEQVAVEALKMGALDYVVKDVEGIYLDLLPMVIERALHQHDLEAQMRLAAQVFENAGEGILVADRQSRIITVNQAFTEITGYLPAEIIGLTLEHLQAEPQGAASLQKIWDSLRTTGGWQGEIWNRRKNGEAFPAWLTLRGVEDQQGRLVNYVGLLTDITFRKQAEDRLRYLATHDPLTGLATRYLFQDHLHQALAQARRSKRAVAVMFLDLDRFKLINDTLGHARGDLVLKGEAERLKASIRESDTAARLGGDEFLGLLTELPKLDDVVWIARKILEATSRPYVFDGRECAVAASIGVSLFPLHGEDPEVLIKNADTAMYRAKERGNCWVFYAPGKE